MNSEDSIRDVFGLTQREMSMLLGTSVSRWSMYESGLRQLPGQALERLSELLKHTSDARPASKRAGLPAAKLDALLRENDYQRRLLERQRTALEKKRLMSERRAQLMTLIRDKKITPPVVPLAPENRNARVDYATKAFEFERRRALLEFERQWLEQKLREG